MSLSPRPPPVSTLPSFSPPLRTHTLITHQRPTPIQTTGVYDANVSQQAPGSPMASAALYLYTFLATLVLLVGISLFIIIRSIIQRRRRNRAIHEAWLRYTNGSIPFREGDLDLITFVEFRMNQAGFAPRSGRVDLSNVPRMWEVDLASEKTIDLEKTAGGKLISSSWKLNQRSNPHLDQSRPSASLAWSSILPLSSAPLITAPNEDGTTPASAAMPVTPNGRRNVSLSGVGRFFGRILYGSGSAPAPGHATQGMPDQSRPNALASTSSPSTTGINPNTNPIDSTDGTSFSRSDHNHTDTQLEEGTLHVHRSSSRSTSQPQPDSSNATNPSQMPSVTVTSTTTEMAESSSTYQQPGQAVGEDHISHRIPSNPHPHPNRIHDPPLTPNRNQEQKIPSGPGDIDRTRMRVAVLVRMPMPPSHAASTPFSPSGLSKAASKAKAKAESGYEIKDEKRLSSSSKSSVSTLGDSDGVQMSLLEVGLADVDLFLDCQCGGGEMNSEGGNSIGEK